MQDILLGQGGYGKVFGTCPESIRKTLDEKRGMRRNLRIKKVFQDEFSLRQAIKRDRLISQIDPSRTYLRSPIMDPVIHKLMRKIKQQADGMASEEIDEKIDQALESPYQVHMRDQGACLRKFDKTREFERKVLDSFYQPLAALFLLYENKAVHCDIKLDNITIDDRTTGNLTDQPITIGLIDFDWVRNMRDQVEKKEVEHPEHAFFIWPLELYYDSAAEKLVLYKERFRGGQITYRVTPNFLSTVKLIRSTQFGIKQAFQDFYTKEEHTFLENMIGCAITRMNFPSRYTIEKVHPVPDIIKDSDIKKVLRYWGMLAEIEEQVRTTTIPYAHAFWEVYGPEGSYPDLKKDWTKIDVLGLGIVAHSFFTPVFQQQVLNPAIKKTFEHFLLSMIHPDPTLRFNGKQALLKWIQIMKVQDPSQYGRIRRELIKTPVFEITTKKRSAQQHPQQQKIDGKKIRS